MLSEYQPTQGAPEVIGTAIVMMREQMIVAV